MFWSKSSKRSKITRRKAKVIYLRLMADLPAGKGIVIGVPVGVTDKLAQRQYDDRNILHGAFKHGDYEVIPLLELFGPKYGFRMVDRALLKLQETAPDFEASDLTEDQVSAFTSLSHALKTTVYDQYDGSNDYPVRDLINQFESAVYHVLLHPDDCPVLERIVRQGVLDGDKALAILEEIKENQLAPSISEGFL